MEAIKTMLDLLINNLVDQPNMVKIDYLDSQNDTLYINIIVYESDKRKVIGKQGCTIQAMRTLVHCLGAKNGIRTYLNLVE